MSSKTICQVLFVFLNNMSQRRVDNLCYPFKRQARLWSFVSVLSAWLVISINISEQFLNILKHIISYTIKSDRDL